MNFRIFAWRFAGPPYGSQGVSNCIEMKTVPLRRRLFLLAAAGIVPLVLAVATGFFLLARHQADQARRGVLDITRALSTAVDAELRRTMSILEVLAASLDVDPRDLDAFSQRAARTLVMQPHWRNVVLSDLNGRHLVNLRRPEGTALADVTQRGSFEQVLRVEAPVVGNLRRNSRGEFVIPVRVPVLRDGRLLYVLTAALDPEAVLDIITRQNVPPDWVVVVVDEDGTRLARSRAHEQSLGTRVSPSLAQSLGEGWREWTGTTHSSEGEEVFTAFVRLHDAPWTVAVGIPPGQLQAGARQFFGAFGGGVLASLLIAIGAALLIARSINRPISQLLRAAQAMGEGATHETTATPIREIQEVADALRRSAEQRAAAEAERNLVLQREQAARAEAEAASRAKDEFLAMLGHELRNPLGAISNAATVLEREPSDGANAASAKHIITRQVAHLARLTDDLLDAGRALTGKIVLRPQPLDLAAIAAQSLGTLKSAKRTGRHTIVQDLQPAWVRADPIRLDQIIGNLVVNAVKYTPAGGTIRVSVRRESDDAVLRVADDGIGLAPELAARAFDLFVQGDRDLDRSQGGLGIGLTLVRRLAQMHGGSASVYSAGIDRGSEFTVRLPAIEAPAHARPQPLAEPKAEGKNILVVEDNEDARETLVLLLRLAGHRVETAADGLEGLEKALATPPDVALLDVGLPRLDGYELARRIRGQPAERRPFLVALTGYGLPEDRKRAFEAGFDVHIVKPVDHDVLAQILATAHAVPTAHEASRTIAAR